MAETPRVSVIAHAHPAQSKGGGEASAYRQFRALRAAGWEASFLAASEVTTRYAARRPVEPVLEWAPGEHLYSFAGMAPDGLGWRDTLGRRALLDFLLGLDAEVYHFHHYWRVGTDLIAALRRARPRARLVITLHEMLAICLNHGQMVRTQGRELCERAAPLACLGCFPDETLERFITRKALLLDMLRGFDAVIYPSDFLRRRYEEWGLVHRRAVTLENLLDPMMLAAPRARDDGAGREGHFAFFGQATPFKGLDLLVQAFAIALARRPDLRLTVHGTEAAAFAAQFPALAGQVQALAPALAFAGPYAPSETLSLMRDAGWVVMPSIWWENSPVVIQEAKRAGTPLLVADIGGMAEKVRPGLDGLHFRRASVTDLSRALLEAAEPGRRAAMAATLADAPGQEAFLDGLASAYAPG